jgi:sterol desaturase/sphingolipid hydroxylase (fatty acid hydroxylase superfamily)
MALPNPMILALPALLSLVLLEALVVHLRRRGHYCWRDSLTSLSLGAGHLVAVTMTAGLVLSIANLVQGHAAIRVVDRWWVYVFCFLAVDLAYYVFHRSAHAVRWFWASHIVHHSSEHYNLSTAFRQSWTGFVSLEFLSLLPLFMLGLQPSVIFFCAGLNLIYQFWLHTELIGQMPRWFEAIMNTPAHHRVHHATNPKYLDRNFGGVFIVWDRLFGTFQRADAGEPPRYGITTPLASFNVVYAALHEWEAMTRDVRSAPGLSRKFRYLFGRVGWNHRGAVDSTTAVRPGGLRGAT